MPHDAKHPPRTRQAFVVALLAAGGIAAAVLTGLAAGRALAPERPAATSRIVHAGAVRLVVPSAWRTIGVHDAGVSGLAPQTTAAFAPSPGMPWRVAVTVTPPDDPSLLPSAVREALRAPVPQPTPTQLGGRRAWLYSGLVMSDRDWLTDVTVLPTTGGVLAVLCGAPATAWSAGGCAGSAEAISLRAGPTLAPSADLALQMRLRRVISKLDEARVWGRAALRRARTPAGQARSARLLAREHRLAAAALRPVAPPSRASLLERLASTARAYSVLARAIEVGSAQGFSAAQRRVDRAELGLARGVDSLAATALPRSAGSPSTPPARERPAGPSLNMLPLVVLVFALVGAGLASLRRRSRPVSAPQRPAAAPDPPPPTSLRATRSPWQRRIEARTSRRPSRRPERDPV
jgi:hypothetical protein